VTDAAFVQCANEDAPVVLGRQFDVAFTSVGVLAWLGDLGSWARAVARLLRPGGVFLVYDAHPMLSAMEFECDDDLLIVGEPYFATGEPKMFDDGVTYASETVNGQQRDLPVAAHLGEILTAVLDAGLRIEAFGEHRSMPWRALPCMTRADDGWRLPPGAPDMPLMFSLIARRPALTGPAPPADRAHRRGTRTSDVRG